MKRKDTPTNTGLADLGIAQLEVHQGGGSSGETAKQALDGLLQALPLTAPLATAGGDHLNAITTATSQTMVNADEQQLMNDLLALQATGALQAALDNNSLPDSAYRKATSNFVAPAFTAGLASIVPAERCAALVVLEFLPELLKAANPLAPKVPGDDAQRDLDLPARMNALGMDGVPALAAGALRFNQADISGAVGALLGEHGEALRGALRSSLAMELLAKAAWSESMAEPDTLLSDATLQDMLMAQEGFPTAGDFHRQFPMVEKLGLAESLRLHVDAMSAAYQLVGAGTSTEPNLYAAEDSYVALLNRFDNSAFTSHPSFSVLTAEERQAHQEAKALNHERALLTESGFSFSLADRGGELLTRSDDLAIEAYDAQSWGPGR